MVNLRQNKTTAKKATIMPRTVQIIDIKKEIEEGFSTIKGFAIEH
jgi:hypothetical protein